MTTQEEIYNKGRVAQSILSNTDLMRFFDEVKEDLKTQMVSTSPDQSKERNIIYFQHLGIENLLSYLSTYAAAAEALEDNE